MERISPWELVPGGDLDEEEIKRRNIKFQEAIRPFIGDFSSWWKRTIDELEKMYKPLKRFDHDKATNLELLNHHYDLINMGRRHWQLHCLGMCAVFAGWVMFEDLCKEILGLSDRDPEFLKLMVGFDSKIFQVDNRLWQLARQATNGGLRDIFLDNEPGSVVPKLEQIEAGKQWLKELRKFLDEHGWRM